jgi:hypothetical protein
MASELAEPARKIFQAFIAAARAKQQQAQEARV